MIHRIEQGSINSKDVLVQYIPNGYRRIWQNDVCISRGADVHTCIMYRRYCTERSE